MHYAIEYTCPADTCIMTLQTVPNLVLKIITGSTCTTPTDLIFQEINVLKIKDYLVLRSTQFIFATVTNQHLLSHIADHPSPIYYHALRFPFSKRPNFTWTNLCVGTVKSVWAIRGNWMSCGWRLSKILCSQYIRSNTIEYRSAHRGITSNTICNHCTN